MLIFYKSPDGDYDLKKNISGYQADKTWIVKVNYYQLE